MTKNTLDQEYLDRKTLEREDRLDRLKIYGGIVAVGIGLSIVVGAGARGIRLLL